MRIMRHWKLLPFTFTATVVFLGQVLSAGVYHPAYLCNWQLLPFTFTATVVVLGHILSTGVLHPA